MRIDQATISLQPRSTSHCIDLAVRFYGRHLQTMLGLWVVVMLPACGLIYELSAYSNYDLRMAILVGLFATLPLGTLLMAGAAPHAFGDPFEIYGSEKKGEQRLLESTGSLLNFAVFGLTVLLLALNSGLDFARPFAQQPMVRMALLGALTGVLAFRAIVILDGFYRLNWQTVNLFLFGFVRRCAMAAGPALCFFGGVWLILPGLILCLAAALFAVRTGFAPEKVFLKELDRKLQSRDTKELMKDERTELFFKGCWIVLFCAILSGMVFLTFDLASTVIFQYPILITRFSETTSYTLLTNDPRVLTVLVAAGLLVYPVARLAWFFCYIDLRVRRDCWDMELHFAHAAERLGTAR